jgi:hypothetical protein
MRETCALKHDANVIDRHQRGESRGAARTVGMHCGNSVTFHSSVRARKFTLKNRGSVRGKGRKNALGDPETGEHMGVEACWG